MEIFFCQLDYQTLKQMPEQVVKFPSLQTLKTQPNKVLSNLI